MPTTVRWGILLIVCYLIFPKLQRLGATRIRKFGRRRRRRWMKRTKKDMEKLDLSPHIKPCLTYANRLYWLTLYQSTEARINPSVLLCLSIPNPLIYHRLWKPIETALGQFDEGKKDDTYYKLFSGQFSKSASVNKNWVRLQRSVTWRILIC